MSGHPSPLFSPNDGEENGQIIENVISPAEKTLLSSLSKDLGQKHRDVRSKANEASGNHPSIVCRAVFAAVISIHLAQFQQKILEIEKDILIEDSGIVGAYRIVPLSRIVGAFDGWGRKLEWLWQLVVFVQPKQAGEIVGNRAIPGSPCTASKIIRYLRDAAQTGYPDIERMALDLVKVAESAWLKQLSAWVLYGRLPSIGNSDFFISQNRLENINHLSMESYAIDSTLLPPFVVPDIAKSILFIGRSLNHLKEKGASGMDRNLNIGGTESAMTEMHLAELSSLVSPITTSSFTTAIRTIRLSLSQNALQRLLPFSRVVEVLQVFRDFFLIQRGEFALALIAAADERLATKLSNPVDNHTKKNGKVLTNVTIKEGEVAGILPRTWAALAPLWDEDDEEANQELDLAREVLQLSLHMSNPSKLSPADDDQLIEHLSEAFNDVLLPTPTALTLSIKSPLDLFLTRSDIITYSRIQAYLLAIRKAHLRLSKTFTLSALRRDHPSPKPSASPDSKSRFESLARKRSRAIKRVKILRPVWASIGSAAFLLAELGAYFQGEVIQPLWEEFFGWLRPKQALTSRPASREAKDQEIGFGVSLDSSKISQSESIPQRRQHRDPETLTIAHKSFLSSLCRSILLDNTSFTSHLRSFLNVVDHAAALMDRLNIVQQNLDLELDGAPENVLANHESEERSLLVDLKTTCRITDKSLKELVEILREIDSAQAAMTSQSMSSNTHDNNNFVAWPGQRLDRLLFKLDYTSPKTTSMVDDWQVLT